MKRAIVLVIIALLLTAMSVNTVYGGWKENYRTKYSKQTLDPDSEKAKKIRRLGNFDFKYLKWKKTPEERKALGIEPKTTLSANLMPWKDKEKDKFEGYRQNFSPARKDLPKEEKRAKTGRTLTGSLKSIGEALAPEEAEEIK